MYVCMYIYIYNIIYIYIYIYIHIHSLILLGAPDLPRQSSRSPERLTIMIIVVVLMLILLIMTSIIITMISIIIIIIIIIIMMRPRNPSPAIRWLDPSRFWLLKWWTPRISRPRDSYLADRLREAGASCRTARELPYVIILCDVMLCYVMLCYDILCHTIMLSHLMLYYAASSYTTPFRSAAALTQMLATLRWVIYYVYVYIYIIYVHICNSNS